MVNDSYQKLIKNYITSYKKLIENNNPSTKSEYLVENLFNKLKNYNFDLNDKEKKIKMFALNHKNKNDLYNFLVLKKGKGKKKKIGGAKEEGSGTKPEPLNLEDIINKHDLKLIMNTSYTEEKEWKNLPKSKFAIITYWWGGDKDNNNIQKPCPEILKKIKELTELKEFGELTEDLQIQKLKNLREELQKITEELQLQKLGEVTELKKLEELKKFEELKKLEELNKFEKFQELINNKKFNEKLEELIKLEEIKEIRPISYKVMIDQWIASCKQKGCNYIVERYPEFEVSGMYQHAINAKPLFIKKALEKCSSEGLTGVVYIDGDMTVNNYPHIFDMDNVDFMARGWNIDPRASKEHLDYEICFDPYVFETSGGIMYFGDSINARILLDNWKNASSLHYNKGKADDRVLSLILTFKKYVIPLNIIQLPIEYLWLSDFYNAFLIKDNNNTYRDIYGELYFEHPACLTSEDTAAKQGASTNRQPASYDTLVSNMNECNIHAGVFYNFVYFDNIKAADSYNKYLEYLSDDNTVLPDVNGVKNTKKLTPYYNVTYGERYGEHETVVKKNLEYFKQYFTIAPSDDDLLNFILNNNIEESKKYMDNKNRKYITVFNKGNQDNIIGRILYHLIDGTDVLYLPNNYNNLIESYEIKGPLEGGKYNDENKKKLKSNLIDQIKLDNLIRKIPIGCELICYNTNDYKPKFIKDTPMYFGKNSKILRHLLLMSTDIDRRKFTIIKKEKNEKEYEKVIQGGFNDVFNSSYIFLSRIRCNWLDPDFFDIEEEEKVVEVEVEVKNTLMQEKLLSLMEAFKAKKAKDAEEAKKGGKKSKSKKVKENLKKPIKNKSKNF